MGCPFFLICAILQTLFARRKNLPLEIQKKLSTLAWIILANGFGLFLFAQGSLPLSRVGVRLVE